MAFRNHLRYSSNKLKCSFALKLVHLGLALLVLGLVSGRVIANKAWANGFSEQERPEVRVVTKEIAPFVIKEGGRHRLRRARLAFLRKQRGPGQGESGGPCVSARELCHRLST